MLVSFGALCATASAGTISVQWDPNTEPNITGYRVYVGTAPNLYTETFDVPADTPFFIYRTAFLGVRYYFAVAAQADGSVYSALSEEVSAVGTRTVSGGRPDGSRVAGGDTAAAVADCGTACFVVNEVATGLGKITSVELLPGGPLLAVEGGSRVVAMGSGSAATVYTAEPGTALREIAVDPQFATNGTVFVSQLRRLDRSSAAFEIVRLRYLSGRLAEPAATVTGVVVPLDADVPFARSDDGTFYVAVPALGRDPYSASVLVFDRDGRAPAARLSGSPVLASGFERPVDVAWDVRSRVLWVAGEGGSQLVWVTADGASGTPPVSLAGGETVAAVGVAGSSVRPLLVAAGPDLVEAGANGANVQRVGLDSYGTPVALASGPAGERFVAVRRDAGGASTYSILEIEDGLAQPPR